MGSRREKRDIAGKKFEIEGTVRLAPPQWAKRLQDQPEGLLFLDELTTSPPAVQAAMLRVVLERVVGETALPSRSSGAAADGRRQGSTPGSADR